MKKLFSTILVLGLLLNFNANADVKWPKFMTKEIPKEILNKINDGSNNEIEDILKQVDIKNKQIRVMLMKTIVQTESAKILMGNSELSVEEQEIIEKLFKKYVQ